MAARPITCSTWNRMPCTRPTDSSRLKCNNNNPLIHPVPKIIICINVHSLTLMYLLVSLSLLLPIYSPGHIPSTRWRTTQPVAMAVAVASNTTPPRHQMTTLRPRRQVPLVTTSTIATRGVLVMGVVHPPSLGATPPPIQVKGASPVPILVNSSSSSSNHSI